MLIDNENKNKKVHEWLHDYTSDGTMDIVTGYFTVGALSYLSKITNEKIKKYRFVLGDIVSTEQLQNNTIDLLNQDITVEGSLKLNKIAKEAVKFLKYPKVEVKTLEPNFCHAKAYIYKDKEDDRLNYFLTGSSNLTEAGIGLKYTNNIELNIAETGNNDQYKNLVIWFEELWNKPQAHSKKTIKNEDGKIIQKDFKEYLIEEITKIFIEYTPKDLYYKTLFELFGEELLKEQNDPEFNKQIGKLENSVVYNTLYNYQKKGVLSLIKMLQKYNGAILADAVGLGKTWSALAVIKHFQLQGYENILLCPKKLENNWQQYLKHAGSRFESDNFEFIIRFHTDLFENRLEKDHRKIKGYFQSDKPKLLIIDESHNLRNYESSRYKFLLENIIKKNHNIKVLLLSATPINNSLNDIKNQFKLMVKDDDHGFNELLDIRSLDGTFRTAQMKFKKWVESDTQKISDFIKELPQNFFKLTDSLTVARTRQMIQTQDASIAFPKKAKPRNIYVTPDKIGNFETFEKLFENMPPKLAAYKPALYIEDGDKTDAIHNEKQRDNSLVKMMYILLLKRLESSWMAFYITVGKIYDYHDKIQRLAITYKTTKKDVKLDTNAEEFFEDEDNEFTVGKRAISLKDIELSGNLDIFIKDIEEDKKALKVLLKNLKLFSDKIEKESTKKSDDVKLEKLINIVDEKKEQQNKKLIIFTVYTDTAVYLYDELLKRGYKKLALVTGSFVKESSSDKSFKKYEHILQRFAPFTKLYKEKHYDDFHGSTYEQWQEWIDKNDKDTQKLLDNEIDILIATDVLSEGQNLQDASMVVNYDIHWNPVRVIQRMGRIDRIGSPNKVIEGVNFWPSNSINNYLNLQNRIEQKMATMKIVGSEVDENFSSSFSQMSEDKTLEQKQTAKMLQQMETSWEDIEVSDKSLGFNDFSLEEFRQDLYEEFQKKNDFYKNMPNGIYTGFYEDEQMSEKTKLVVLLKNRKNNQFALVYIDKNGKQLLENEKEVLEFLSNRKNKKREVPKDIDDGEADSIKELQEMISRWVESLSTKKFENEDGTVEVKAGKQQLGILQGLKDGAKNALVKTKESGTVEDEFDIKNYDLIVWFVVK